jgi:amidase
VELVGRSATGLADLVRTGRSSASEVTRAHLEQLARVEHRLGAFVVTRRRAALEEAAAVDARPDRDRLPLAGVPVAIKDEIDVAGEPTRFGSLGTRPDAARRDDPLVARLRDAGAVVLGKTRSSEFGLWGATDDAGGITVNPWDPSRSPVARRGVRPRRSPPAWCRSRWPPTGSARSGSRRRPAGSSASSPAPTWSRCCSRTGRPTGSG